MEGRRSPTKYSVKSDTHVYELKCNIETENGWATDIPVSSAQTQIMMGRPATIDVEIPPIKETYNIQPRTLVFVFFRDRLKETTWRLLFCGSVLSHSHVKTSARRASVLHCGDTYSYLQTVYLFQQFITGPRTGIDYSQAVGSRNIREVREGRKKGYEVTDTTIPYNNKSTPPRYAWNTEAKTLKQDIRTKDEHSEWNYEDDEGKEGYPPYPNINFKFIFDDHDPPVCHYEIINEQKIKKSYEVKVLIQEEAKKAGVDLAKINILHNLNQANSFSFRKLPFNYLLPGFSSRFNIVMENLRTLGLYGGNVYFNSENLDSEEFLGLIEDLPQKKLNFNNISKVYDAKSLSEIDGEFTYKDVRRQHTFSIDLLDNISPDNLDLEIWEEEWNKIKDTDHKEALKWGLAAKITLISHYFKPSEEFCVFFEKYNHLESSDYNNFRDSVQDETGNDLPSNAILGFEETSDKGKILKERLDAFKLILNIAGFNWRYIKDSTKFVDENGKTIEPSVVPESHFSDYNGHCYIQTSFFVEEPNWQEIRNNVFKSYAEKSSTAGTNKSAKDTRVAEPGVRATSANILGGTSIKALLKESFKQEEDDTGVPICITDFLVKIIQGGYVDPYTRLELYRTRILNQISGLEKDHLAKRLFDASFLRDVVLENLTTFLGPIVPFTKILNYILDMVQYTYIPNPTCNKMNDSLNSMLFVPKPYFFDVPACNKLHSSEYQEFEYNRHSLTEITRLGVSALPTLAVFSNQNFGEITADILVAPTNVFGNPDDGSVNSEEVSKIHEHEKMTGIVLDWMRINKYKANLAVSAVKEEVSSSEEELTDAKVQAVQDTFPSTKTVPYDYLKEVVYALDNEANEVGVNFFAVAAVIGFKTGWKLRNRRDLATGNRIGVGGFDLNPDNIVKMDKKVIPDKSFFDSFVQELEANAELKTYVEILESEIYQEKAARTTHPGKVPPATKVRNAIIEKLAHPGEDINVPSGVDKASNNNLDERTKQADKNSVRLAADWFVIELGNIKNLLNKITPEIEENNLFQGVRPLHRSELAVLFYYCQKTYNNNQIKIDNKLKSPDKFKE